MNHNRGRGDRFNKGPQSGDEDEAGRAFVQEARENLNMSKFLLSDSPTYAPMHSFVNLSTIIEENESPDSSSIPRKTVQCLTESSCSTVSVAKKELLDDVIEIPVPNPALFRVPSRSFFGATTRIREDSHIGRASERDYGRLVMPLNCSSWTLGSSSQQEGHDMSTTARSTIFKLQEPYIVLQGLAARFETCNNNSKVDNNKPPSPPKRKNSINDEEDVIAVNDVDEEFFIEVNKAVSAEQESPSLHDTKRTNDSMR